MTYGVIEVQENNGVLATLTYGPYTEAQAEGKYHAVLSTAAESQIQRHGAIFFSSDLRSIKREIYDRVNPEPID